MNDKNMSLGNILLPYQRKFVSNTKKKKIWLSSRQVGKSFALSFVACQKALAYRNALVLCISTGARAATELIKKCLQMADAVKIISDGKINYTNSADCIKFSTGGRILSLPSGNPSALRGYTAETILIDECAFIEQPEQVFAAIAPTMTRNPDANLIVTSTPAGKNNFFYKLLTEADDDWYVQTTTIEDAVNDGLKVNIEELKATVKDPDVFDQEYMCKFSNEYSALIDTNLLDWYDEEVVGEKTLLGMDVGSVSDRTAFVTIKQKEDMLFVDDIVVMHKASYESQLQILRELHNKYGYASGRIDQNGIGSALAEFATKTVSSKIIGYTWTSANKTPAYENLRAKVFDHKIKFNSKFKSLLVNDFANVHRIVNETGKVRYEAGRDKNGHSDIVSALVLALEAMSKVVNKSTLPIMYSNTSRFGNKQFRI